jgi:hypothetical protein
MDILFYTSPVYAQVIYTSFFHWFTLSVVDHGFDPDQVIPKTVKLVFATSQLSMQHKGVNA